MCVRKETQEKQKEGNAMYERKIVKIKPDASPPPSHTPINKEPKKERKYR